MSQGEAVVTEERHFGGSLLGPSERRVYRSQLGLVCGDLRGTVGSWPASGDSVKGQEESKCPFLGHPSFSVNVPLLPGPLRWHFAQRHRPKASPWWPLPSAAPGLLPPVSLSRGVPPSDGSWAQGRLKAPLNRLCVVRGDSHTKRPEADRLHPGALAGWGCDHRFTPHLSPSSGTLRLLAHTEVRGSGRRGEIEKSRGKLQPPFPYHCDDLLQASHPLTQKACLLPTASGQLHSLEKQTAPMGGPVSATLGSQQEHIITSKHKGPVFKTCSVFQISTQSQHIWQLLFVLLNDPVTLITIQILIWVCRVLIVAGGIFSCSMWDLVPRPGIEHGPPALGARTLSHWTTSEVPATEVLF